MKKVALIVGPTAIGKTDLSLELAKQLAIEIVSADSRQVYRGMNIGTAKPSPDELAAVPHHFVNHKNPDEYYSAGQFGKEARVCVEEIFARNKQPVIVGGSGLYIRGLVDGFFDPPVADEKIKAKLQAELTEKGLVKLYKRLVKLDHAAAKQLKATDKQRILRALEVNMITGKPWSEFLKKKPTAADFHPVFFGLTLDRTQLYQRIEKRVDGMIASGLVDEVQQLQKAGYGADLNALRTVGYQEVFQYLENQIDESAMVSLIKQKSRNYAKRQLTWFRKDTRITWRDLSENASADIVSEIVSEIGDKSGAASS